MPDACSYIQRTLLSVLDAISNLHNAKFKC
jgi:hypothetical protein